MKEIGTGIEIATTGVVKKKYGDEAGEAVHNSLDAVGNLVQITNVTKDVISKELEKDTDEQHQQQL